MSSAEAGKAFSDLPLVHQKAFSIRFPIPRNESLQMLLVFVFCYALPSAYLTGSLVSEFSPCELWGEDVFGSSGNSLRRRRRKSRVSGWGFRPFVTRIQLPIR